MRARPVGDEASKKELQEHGDWRANIICDDRADVTKVDCTCIQFSVRCGVYASMSLVPLRASVRRISFSSLRYTLLEKSCFVTHRLIKQLLIVLSSLTQQGSFILY